MKVDDRIPAWRAQNGCLSLLTWNCMQSPYDGAGGQSVTRWSLLKHTRECVNGGENIEQFSEGQYRVVQWNKRTKETERGAFDSREKRLLALRCVIPVMCVTNGRECSQKGNLFRKDVLIFRIQEVGGGCGDWMELAQDRDRWRALVNTVMNFQVP